MQKLTRILAFAATAVALACANSVQADTGNQALFELQVTGYAGRGEGDSLLATQLYAEKLAARPGFVGIRCRA